MKKLLFLFSCALFFFAQLANAQDLSFKYSFQSVEGSYLSVAQRENRFYLGSWSEEIHGTIRQHAMDGQYLGNFTIQGLEGPRNFASDGSNYYVVNNTMDIYKIDLVAHTILGTIPVSCTGVPFLRYIAYDPTLNGGAGGFWVGGNNEIAAVSMNGTQVVSTVSGVVEPGGFIMGTAYDPYSNPANPCLWLTQMIMDGHAFIRKFDINTKTLTSFIHDCVDDHPECGGNAAGGAFGYIDVDNGAYRLAVNVQTSPNTILIYDVVDITPAGAPKPVTNLTVTPGTLGALTANISWVNPAQTHSGATLNQLTAIRIYQDDVLIQTLTNPQIGGPGTYTATVSEPGKYTYKVVAVNNAGISKATSLTSAWIGHDIPSAPTNLVLNADQQTWQATVTWSAPSQGLNNGYFSPANLVYNVYRISPGIAGETLVANGQAGTTFTETLSTPGTYYYKVTARNHVGIGGSSTTDEVMFCNIVSTFPWTEQFSQSEPFPPVCWIRTTNSSQQQWALGVGGMGVFSPPYSAGHAAVTEPTDSWLVTPAIAVPVNGNYVLEFQSRVVPNSFPLNHQIWVSTESNDPASGTFQMIKQLVNGVDYTMIGIGEWKQLVLSLNEFQGQTIYIGFRHYLPGYTPGGYFGSTWYIDDITVRDIPSMEVDVQKIYGAVSPMVGQPFIYKTVLRSTGSTPLSGYTVKLVDGANNVLATNTVGPDIPPLTIAILDFDWIPSTEGEMSLKAVVEFPEDLGLPNSVSPAFPINVQAPAQIFEGVIGPPPGYATYTLPFTLGEEYSASQSIYFKHEIMNRGGVITQIQYLSSFLNFDTYTTTHYIRISMANTNQDKLNAWVPESDLTVVFEGDVLFPKGDNIITLELNEPFVYTGDNLVIMALPIGPSNWTGIGGRQFYNTETPEFTSRSRFYTNRLAPLDMSVSPGSSLSNHANLRFTMTLTEMGSVSGTVTSDGTTPLAGALVEVVGSTQKRTTDQNGEYSFDYLTAGEYQFKVSKFGYSDVTTDAITVVEDENTVVDVILPPLTTCTVSGKVIGSDTNAALENVIVTLSGYENLSDTTNANGDYSFTNVYGGHTYNIKAELQGYDTYTATVEVNGNVTHNITLNEIPYPVVGLRGEIIDDKAEITWNAPNGSMPRIFRYDSGILEGQVGWSAGTRNSIVGALHNVKGSELHNMSWFSTDNLVQPAYDLWVLGLDDNGKPDRNKPIFIAQDVPNTPLKWCTYEFKSPISAPDGFFIGVSPSNGGFTSVGTAESTSEYPFIYNVNLQSMNIGDEFTCFSTDYFYVNAMIRAEGYSTAKTYKTDNEGAKTLVSYTVYRLLDGQQDNESSWVQLADNLTDLAYTDLSWSGLSPGIYRYAVKAQYSNNVFSIPNFTAKLLKDMEFNYTVNLSTNSGDPVTGAVITFTNLDEISEHVYTKTANADVIEFSNVWRGTYDITVTLNGFNKYLAQNIVIETDGSLDVLLEEKIIAPFALTIEETGTAGERRLTWNVLHPTSYILDDGSFEDGYVFQPGFDFSLGNKFVVGESGVLTGIDLFGLNNPYADIFGQNSVTVDIYDQDLKLVGKSLPFYIPSNIWGNIPLDSIPYSDTFYAMIHWYPTGTGWTHGLGVDYDGPNANRNLDMLLYENEWSIAHIEFQDYPLVFAIRVNAATAGPTKSKSYDNTNVEVSGVIKGSISEALMRIEPTAPVYAEDQYVGASKKMIGYTVYLNDVEMAYNIPETNYKFTGLENGTYTAGVKSVYSTGESIIVYSNPFEVEDGIGIENFNLNNVVLYPNPFTNEIYISDPELVKNVEIRNVVGQMIKEFVFNGKSISTGELSNGVYFITLESFDGDKSVFKMVK